MYLDMLISVPSRSFTRQSLASYLILFYTIATSSSVPRQRWLIVIEKKVGALIAFYRALASRIFRTWGKSEKLWGNAVQVSAYVDFGR